MIVVADASPVACLHAIGRLDLLHDVFGSIVVPTAVAAELARGAGPRHVAVDAVPWIEVMASTGPEPAFRRQLGAGERQAITVALELHADRLLIDDRIGRAEAARIGLRVVGLLGVLRLAKDRGVIPAVGPVIDALRSGSGIRLSDAVVRDALQAAGELTE